MTKAKNTIDPSSDPRFANRRRMAWLSFWLIGGLGVGLIMVGMASDSVVARIDKLSFIIGSLFGVWGGIVLAYFGASAYTDRNDLKYNAVPMVDPMGAGTYPDEVVEGGEATPADGQRRKS